jgi:hypothetical protein
MDFSLPEIDYTRHPVYAPFLDGRDPARDRAINVAFEETRAAFAGHFRAEVLARPDDPSDHARPATHRALIEHGISAFVSPEPLASEALARMRQVFDALEAIGRKEAQAYLLPVRETNRDDPRLSAIIEQMFSVAEAYVRTLELVALARRVLGTETIAVKATARETTPEIAAYFLNELGGEADRRSPAIGMHFDVPMNSLKLIVYVEDVRDISGGPFCYIPRSHRRPGAVDDTLDRTAVDALYGRKWFQGPGDLMGLTPERRRRAGFGADCLAGDPATKALLAAEKRITAPAGTALLFDTLGVHRGGLVTEGRRRILQIGLFDARPLSLGPSHREAH